MRREFHVSAFNFLTENKRSRNDKKSVLDGVTNEVAAVSLAENCRLVGLLCEVIQSVDLLRDAASTRVSFLFFVFLPH